MTGPNASFEVPNKPIPYPPEHKNVDSYLEKLLHFMTTSETLQVLCGGVHVLDFFTSKPDLYSRILPVEWREWLSSLHISELLDLLMREDLDPLLTHQRRMHHNRNGLAESTMQDSKASTWRGKALPPLDLLEYIHSIRSLSLERHFTPREDVPTSGLPANLAVGMKTKKVHEVENFAAFINSLVRYLNENSDHEISHIVDFGSGRNYLGRVLASPIYRKRVVAVESKSLNIDGAKSMDVTAKLAKKAVVWRNKKAFRATGIDNGPWPSAAFTIKQSGAPETVLPNSSVKPASRAPSIGHVAGGGHIQYVEHKICDGHLNPVVQQVKWQLSDHDAKDICLEESESHAKRRPHLMVVSLHSCGNLLHHGVRSLILNPEVKAVAMIGCCYNLATERLGPATYKLPELRPQTRRLEDTSTAYDPHGFPMSESMCQYLHPNKNEKGIRWNITARMMAVQAPQNWTLTDCESFFTRHFYRALLQRIFLDYGVVEPPRSAESADSLRESGDPLIIGSLRKACYNSFIAYVRGAMERLMRDSEMRSTLTDRLKSLTDAEISGYEERFQHKKHELCIIWSLMAFSAGVVEACFVADRWLYLREQPEVRRCWVQPVFEYSQSPRNLVVVGIKK